LELIAKNWLVDAAGIEPVSPDKLPANVAIRSKASYGSGVTVVAKAPDVGYDEYADLQFFLAEAEMLRRWGQTWLPPRTNSKPLLPPDVWQVPENWEPPKRRPNWPQTGGLPDLTLPEHLLAELNAAGRPPIAH